MLNLVSFTGADNNTNVDELAKFVEGYEGSPIAVELALLYFPEKEGEARNPDAKQREAILNAIPKKNLAAHLCGKQIFDQLLAEDEAVIAELQRYNRIQLNINARKRIFTPKEVFTVYANLWKREIPMILQFNEDSRDDVEHFAYHPAVFGSAGRPMILFDASRGKGVAPAEFPRALPALHCGYAGGLNPTNITDVNVKLREWYDAHNAVYFVGGEGRPYWLDMESGVRTNNEFDLDLCRKVMDAVSV